MTHEHCPGRPVDGSMHWTMPVDGQFAQGMFPKAILLREDTNTHWLDEEHCLLAEHLFEIVLVLTRKCKQ